MVTSEKKIFYSKSNCKLCSQVQESLWNQDWMGLLNPRERRKCASDGTNNNKNLEVPLKLYFLYLWYWTEPHKFQTYYEVYIRNLCVC